MGPSAETVAVGGQPYVCAEGWGAGGAVSAAGTPSRAGELETRGRRRARNSLEDGSEGRGGSAGGGNAGGGERGGSELGDVSFWRRWEVTWVYSTVAEIFKNTGFCRIV